VDVCILLDEELFRRPLSLRLRGRGEKRIDLGGVVGEAGTVGDLVSGAAASNAGEADVDERRLLSAVIESIEEDVNGEIDEVGEVGREEGAGTKEMRLDPLISIHRSMSSLFTWPALCALRNSKAN